MKEQIELKNCPFCGEELEKEKEFYFHWKKAKEGCPARHPGAINTKSWNSRADGWISVKDRLPEYNKNCLFIGKIFRPESNWNGPYVMFGKRECTSALGEVFVCLVTNVKFYNNEKYLNNVTHWQPLPKPPKEIS